MRKLVLFDVDNTIIKGNLTTIICSRAINSSPDHFLTWISLLFEATRLLHRHFLEQIERCLITHDFVQLDQEVQQYAQQCYQTLFKTLQKDEIDQEKLLASAKAFFAPLDFIEKHCYPQALATIESALNQPNSTVIFISGGLSLFLNLFVQKLNQYFQEQKMINSSIIAFGSTLHNDGTQNILVGSKKADLAKQYIEQLNLPTTIHSVYSDNRYFADLPLLQLATERAVIIDTPSLFYQLLPKEILLSLHFNPAWKKSYL